MKFFDQHHVTVTGAIVLVVLTIVVLIVVVSVVLALFFPIVTNDYEFIRVPTLTSIAP